jgi:uncharacterized protein
MRIAEHIHTHSLTRVSVIVQGGEPLLAGSELISHLVTSIRNRVGPRVQVDAVLQTNGIGLDVSYLQLFADLDLRVGISLDGNAQHMIGTAGTGTGWAATPGS